MDLVVTNKNNKDDNAMRKEKIMEFDGAPGGCAAALFSEP